MHIIRWTLAAIYYYATYAHRCRRMRAAMAAGRAPIGVIAFHRIADDRANDWTTSTSTFAAAIRWLKDRCDLISLADAQRRIRSRSNDRLSICLTFDDGYADNCRDALPLILAEGIPCTYFVATKPVLEQAPFPHDLRHGRPLKPNTIEELRELAAAGIEIGAHSRTHADLGRVGDRDVLIDEVIAARDDLRDALGHPVRYFAFPFGRRRNLSAEAFDLARRAGFEGVCSAYGGYNFPGDDAFHLRRRLVDGPLLRVKNWVTVDPFPNLRTLQSQSPQRSAGSPSYAVETRTRV
jgi:peptidoglycan/xylan/chitin deacetylase (PgdA/CDA1 family)